MPITVSPLSQLEDPYSGGLILVGLNENAQQNQILRREETFRVFFVCRDWDAALSELRQHSDSAKIASVSGSQSRLRVRVVRVTRTSTALLL